VPDYEVPALERGKGDLGGGAANGNQQIVNSVPERLCADGDSKRHKSHQHGVFGARSPNFIAAKPTWQAQHGNDTKHIGVQLASQSASKNRRC